MLANASIQEATCAPSRASRALSRPLLERGAALGERTYFVYIMASRRNGTLYIGVTTTKYGVKKLVWCEQYGDVIEAIAREKQLKTWERKWKPH
jgi:hypothetical protein